jgi:hypothetical protein
MSMTTLPISPPSLCPCRPAGVPAEANDRAEEPP